MFIGTYLSEPLCENQQVQTTIQHSLNTNINNILLSNPFRRAFVVLLVDLLQVRLLQTRHDPPGLNIHRTMPGPLRLLQRRGRT